jgi:acetyl-CoA carboxylase carboxyltransferase component
MGGARMHCTVSGLGDLLARDEHEAIALGRAYFSYVPRHYREDPPIVAGVPAPQCCQVKPNEK